MNIKKIILALLALAAVSGGVFFFVKQSPAPAPISDPGSTGTVPPPGEEIPISAGDAAASASKPAQQNLTASYTLTGSKVGYKKPTNFTFPQDVTIDSLVITKNNLSDTLTFTASYGDNVDDLQGKLYPLFSKIATTSAVSLVTTFVPDLNSTPKAGQSIVYSYAMNPANASFDVTINYH